MSHRIVALLLALLLAACATRTSPGAVASLPDVYTVQGRVAINAAGKGYSASFNWSHQQASDQIDILNPLGQTLARIEVDAVSARFHDRNGQQREAQDLETLSQRELGWPLPVAGLRFWLLGLADPTRPASWATQDKQRTLTQDGWQISYPDNDTDSTPSRIVLSRPDLTIRISLSDWQLNR